MFEICVCVFASFDLHCVVLLLFVHVCESGVCLP